MWKINWFMHLVSFTSEKTCVEDKLLLLERLKWLALPVVIVEDGIAMKRI